MLLFPILRIFVYILILYKDFVNSSEAQKSSTPAQSKLNIKITKKSTSVDIDNKETTSSYNYFKNTRTNTGTYITKPGYKFDKIFQKKSSWNWFGSDKLIWQAQNENEYAIKVLVDGLGTCKSTQHVEVHMSNRDIENFVKSGGCFGNQWVHGDTKKAPTKKRGSDTVVLTLTGLQFFTQGSTAPNDTSQYQVKFLKNMIQYEFKDASRCVKVIYPKDFVWKHDPNKHKDQYPKHVIVFPRTKVVMILFKDEYLYVYKHSSNQWRSLFSGKPNPIQLDIKSQATTDLYAYHLDKNTKMGTFSAKGNTVFQEVIRTKPTCRCGSDQTLYQASTTSTYAYKVVLDGVGSSDKRVLLYLLNGKVLTLYKLSESCRFKGWFEYDPGVKIVTHGSAAPNDTTKYDLEIVGDDVYHIFKQGSECSEVRLDDDTVWTHEGDLRHPYPKTVVYDNKSKLFVLSFDGENVIYKKEGIEWMEEVIKSSGSKDVISAFKLHVLGLPMLTLSETKIFTEGSEEPNDTTKYELKVESNMLRYDFKDKAKCIKVMYAKDLVWKHDPAKHKDQYPKSVLIHADVKTIFIVFQTSMYLYRQAGDEWFGGQSQSIQLDVRTKESNNQYNYKKDFTTSIFSAKGNTVFKKIILTKHSLNCCGSDRTIHQAINYYQCAYKVVLDAGSSDEKIRLHLVNGKVLCLRKVSKNCSYQGYYPYNVDKVEVEVESSSLTNDTTTYDIFRDDDNSDFVFKPGERCTELKYSGETLWKHDLDKPYPKSVSYEKDQNKFSLNFDDFSLVYRKEGNEWMGEVIKSSGSKDVTSAFKLHVLGLPMLTLSETKIFTEGSEEPNDTTKYELKIMTTLVQYDFKDSAKCTKVVYGDTKIWYHDPERHKDQYPKHVIVFPRTKIVMILFEDEYLYVYKHSSNQWRSLFSGKPNPIQLDIKSQATNDLYAYHDYLVPGIFKPNENVGFNKVFQKKCVLNFLGSDTVIWEAQNENEYAVRVTRDGTRRCRRLERIDIELSNGDVLKFVKTGGCCAKQWTHVETKKGEIYRNSQSSKTNSLNTKVQLIGLDVDSQKSSCNHEYTKLENTKMGTFSAKGNTVFQEVIRKKGSLSCGSDQTLYEATTTSTYAYKVVLDGVGSSDKRVLLYLLNGKVLTLQRLTKSCRFQGWVEYDPGVKIFTHGSTAPNDTTKYDFVEEDGVVTYSFKQGSKCTELLFDDDVVWSHPDNASYPKSVIYDKTSASFLLSFDDMNVIYRKHLGEWAKGLITLDIRKEPKEFINYYKDDKEDLRYYSPKQEFVFNIVKKSSRGPSCCSSDTVIWEAQTPDDYLYKAILKGSGDKPKYLALFPSKGNFFLYFKDKNGGWRDITSNRISFGDFTFFGTDLTSEVRKLDSSSYERSVYKFFFGYRFNDTVQCSKINYKGVNLWSHGDGKSFPDGLYLNLFDKSLFLLLPGPKWELLKIPTPPKAATPTTPSVVTPTPKVAPAVTPTPKVVEPTPTPSVVTPTPTTPAVTPTPKAVEPTTPTPVVVTPPEPAPKVAEDTTPTTPVVTPTPKVAEVVEPTPTPSVVTPTPTTPAVTPTAKVAETQVPTLDLSNVKIFVLGKDNKPKVITSDDYELLEYHNNLVGFIFKEGVRCVSFKHNNNTVWKLDRSKNGNEFPESIFYKVDSLVYVDFAPFFYAYKYDTGKKVWAFNENTSYTGSGLLDPFDHPKYLNIVTSDDPVGKILKTNDTSKYRLYGYSNRIFLYVLNDGVKCHEFRFKDRSVWTYDGTKQNKFPKSISVDISQFLTYFQFDDKVTRVQLSRSQLLYYPIKSEVTILSESELKSLRAKTDGIPKRRTSSRSSDETEDPGEDCDLEDPGGQISTDVVTGVEDSTTD